MAARMHPCMGQWTGRRVYCLGRACPPHFQLSPGPSGNFLVFTVITCEALPAFAFGTPALRFALCYYKQTLCVCVCFCVRERERETEREHKHMCVCAHTRMSKEPKNYKFGRLKDVELYWDIAKYFSSVPCDFLIFLTLLPWVPQAFSFPGYVEIVVSKLGGWWESRI